MISLTLVDLRVYLAIVVPRPGEIRSIELMLYDDIGDICHDGIRRVSVPRHDPRELIAEEQAFTILSNAGGCGPAEWSITTHCIEFALMQV